MAVQIDSLHGQSLADMAFEVELERSVTHCSIVNFQEQACCGGCEHWSQRMALCSGGEVCEERYSHHRDELQEVKPGA